eukprot:s477_g2.t1
MAPSSSEEENSEESEEASEKDNESEEKEEETAAKKEKSEEPRRRRRHHRSTHDRSRDRDRRRDKGPERDRRRRREATPAVPEPENPPKIKLEENQGNKGGKDGQKGGPKRHKYWTCLDCGNTTAPFHAAMDQHRHLNELCMAHQAWNALSREEQNEAGAWARCKYQARCKKWGRRSELVDHDGFDPTDLPGDDDFKRSWSAYSARGSSVAPPRREPSAEKRKPVQLEKKQKKKSKKGKKGPDSSPENPKKRESTSSPDDHKGSKKRSKQVVINIH